MYKSTYRALNLSSSSKVTTTIYTLGCGVRAALVQMELQVRHTCITTPWYYEKESAIINNMNMNAVKSTADLHVYTNNQLNKNG